MRRAEAPWVVTVVGMAVVLAGCIGPWSGGESDDVPGFTGSLAPGQEWHYRGDNGIFQNWTINKIENRHGFETYNITIHWSRPDQDGRDTYLRWIHVKSLGVVAQQSAVYTWADCPVGRILPLQPKEYQCTARMEQHNQERELDLSVSVGEEQQVSPAIGSFRAIEVITINNDRNETLSHGWFNQSAGYFVEFYDDRGDFGGDVLFELVEWTGSS